MHDSSTKVEVSLQKKLLLGIVFGSPMCVHFHTLPCLESFLPELRARQFCGVALPKFMTLIIPANKRSSREERKKALRFGSQQQP